MKAAAYLKARGWLYQPEGDGFDSGPLWIDAISTSELSTVEDAVTIQRARDAAEERRCVADAIANAASRHSKLDHDAAMANVMAAAGMAQTAWLRIYGVEVEP